MEIKVQNIELANLDYKSRLIGYVNIILDNVFVIKGLKIIQGHKRKFISMPVNISKRIDSTTGQHFRYEIVHPINNNFRIKLEKIILDEFERIQDGNKEKNSH